MYSSEVIYTPLATSRSSGHFITHSLHVVHTSYVIMGVTLSSNHRRFIFDWQSPAIRTCVWWLDWSIPASPGTEESTSSFSNDRYFFIPDILNSINIIIRLNGCQGIRISTSFFKINLFCCWNDRCKTSAKEFASHAFRSAILKTADFAVSSLHFTRSK